MSSKPAHKIMDEKLLAQLGKGHNIYLRSRANSRKGKPWQDKSKLNFWKLKIKKTKLESRQSGVKQHPTQRGVSFLMMVSFLLEERIVGQKEGHNIFKNWGE